MSHIVDGSSAVFSNNLGDTPPSPALKEAMDAFWCLFNSNASYLSPPSQFTTPMEKHWLNMFATVVNNLMSQLTLPLGAAGSTIYNLLNAQKFLTSSGTGTIASICAESDPTRTQDLLYAFGDTKSGLTPPIINILNQLDNGHYGCALGNWYTSYGFETPQLSPTIFGFFQTLEGNLEIALAHPGSDAAWDNVTAAILDLNNALNQSGSLDGFSFFLKTYLDANFSVPTDSKQESLTSLSTAIYNAGGVAKDPTDAAALYQLFLPNAPNTNGGVFADLMQNGWIGSILYGHDNPYNPKSGRSNFYA